MSENRTCDGTQFRLAIDHGFLAENPDLDVRGRRQGRKRMHIRPPLSL